jgi:hypothetical protein
MKHLNAIFEIEYLEFGTIETKKVLVFESSEIYLIINDLKDKIEDIIKMPDYIQNDWIKYNSKDLKLSDIDMCTNICIERINRNIKYIDKDEYFEKINTLKNLKRHLVLQNLL